MGFDVVWCDVVWCGVVVWGRKELPCAIFFYSLNSLVHVIMAAWYGMHKCIVLWF